MTDAESAGGESAAPRETATVFFAEAEDYRIVHADGIWGGVTPQLDVYMQFYTEFKEPPESVTYSIDGQRLKEDSRTGREALVRQLQVGIMINVRTARALQAWLGDKIREADRATQEIARIEEDLQ